MKEKWHPVKEYEGLYEVSNFGNVRSLDRIVKNRYSFANRKGRILKPTPDRVGYLQVQLSRPDPWRVKPAKVHRLVAFAFFGDPPHPTAHVNHLNFDKADNRIDNLEWCTPKQNTRHAVENGRFTAVVSPSRAKKLTIEQVIEIKHIKKSSGISNLKIAEQFSLSRRTVDRIIKGDIWADA